VIGEIVRTETDGNLGSISSPSILPQQKVPLDVEIREAVLPGNGEKGEDCGSLVLCVCRECGHRWKGERSCLRRECPVCYEKWAFREAMVASWRMWTGSKMIARDQMWSWRECSIVHAIVSIVDVGQTLDEAKAEAYRVFREHRVLGGTMVFHPFDQVGYLKFHATGFVHGRWEPGTNADPLFRVIRDPGSSEGAPVYRGIRDVKALRRCIQYLLTHAGILEGRHALTWWGLLSYNKLPSSVLKEAYPDAYAEIHYSGRRCPVCGSHAVDWTQYDRCETGYFPVTPPDPEYRHGFSSRWEAGVCPVCGILTRGSAGSEYGVCPVCGVDSVRRTWGWRACGT
jgi:hypothetical protein